MLKEVQEKLKQVELTDDEIESNAIDGAAASREDESNVYTKKKVMVKKATLEKAKPGNKKLKKKSGEPILEEADPADAVQRDFQGAYSKFSTPKTAISASVLQDFSFAPLVSRNATPIGHPDLLKRKGNQPLKEVVEHQLEENDSASDVENDEDDSEDSELEERSSEEERIPSRRPMQIYHRPTKAQLSARQFLSKKLPVFSGKLED